MFALGFLILLLAIGYAHSGPRAPQEAASRSATPRGAPAAAPG